jgi:hypothetical protein
MFVGAYTIQDRLACQSKTTARGFSALALAEIDSWLGGHLARRGNDASGKLAPDGQSANPRLGPLGHGARMQGAAEAAGRYMWTGEMTGIKGNESEQLAGRRGKKSPH